MIEHGPPILYVLFLWWFSTGAILFLNGLPRRSFAWSMAGTTAVLGLSLCGLAATSDDTSVAGAYLAFTFGLLTWGWHEVAFLLGYVTGPDRSPCPPGRTGWARFPAALRAILHHELAILATAFAVVVLTWGGANQIGTWTFALLWVMRVSAKLNVFMGVPNLDHDLLPEHLGYLKSFFAKKPMNALFPVSVTLSTLAVAFFAQAAANADGSAFDSAAFTMLGTLAALALLEHWFLVLPLPDAALWGWALRARGAASRAAPGNALEARILRASAWAQGRRS